MQKKVTISLDSVVYKDFQRYCEEKDIIVSKRIERLIKKEMEDKGFYKDEEKNEE